MRHNRKPALLRHFERHVEGRSSRSPAGVAPDPHLDASDQIAVGLDDAHAFAQVEQPQIGAFADHHAGTKGEDAGKGNVEEGDDAQRRRLDHMAAKTWKLPGPALPASTKVVVPLRRATSAASTPSEVPPQ